MCVYAAGAGVVLDDKVGLQRGHDSAELEDGCDVCDEPARHARALLSAPVPEELLGDCVLRFKVCVSLSLSLSACRSVVASQ